MWRSGTLSGTVGPEVSGRGLLDPTTSTKCLLTLALQVVDPVYAFSVSEGVVYLLDLFVLTVSIDSGGPRGVSQLTILDQLVHRMKHDTGNEHTIKPCGVFDMIGGVGSGGFIAILLVLFGLKTEEALDEFIDMTANVLDKQGVDAETRTAALKRHIDGLLEKYRIDGNSHIIDHNDRPMGCKLVIPISYKHHAGSICILRNYSLRKEKTLNLTIAEAMMATLATPPMFTSTQILKDAAIFDYISADWMLSNPIEEIIAEAHQAIGAEQRVACILSLGCGHPGVFAAPDDSSTSAWNEFLENLVTDSERKAEGIDSQMGHLGFYHRFSVMSGLKKPNTKRENRHGDIVTHTQAYLDSATVSRKMDSCIHSLRKRDGVSSLDQLSKFPFQIFIDGSSEDRIRADIMQSVRSLGTEHSQKRFEDCLLFLSSPGENIVRLLVYDNVDDPDIDIASLLPQGDWCAVVITSRNGLLGDLHPKAH
ncbi:hypothetical protein M408DRAFT_65913, partial [Serendipita vermifera MAFF 305830]